MSVLPRHLRLGVVIALGCLPFLPASCGDGIDVTLGGSSASHGDSGGDVSSEGGQIDTNPADGADSSADSPPEAGCEGGQPPVGTLFDERVGFGANATGGGVNGCVYHVTKPDDSGEGSLRAGLDGDEPRWIVFDQDFSIELESNLKPGSNKTIDGRGKKVTLKDYGITIDNKRNFIIESISFVGKLPVDDACEDDDTCVQGSDAITLQGTGARNIWISHCSLKHYRDGLIDIVGGATDITISWSTFTDHETAMLIGTENDDPAALKETRVTLHHNLFELTESRNPRVRYAYVHMFNNALNSWGDYGVAASQESRVFSDFNIYFAGPDSTQAVNNNEGKDPTRGNFRWTGDDMLNGAERILDANVPEAVADPGYVYQPETFSPDASGGLLVDIINKAQPR